jgi:endonuclease-8
MTKSWTIGILRREHKVPEGDTIFRAARTLHRALAGSIVTAFETQLPGLARIDTDYAIAGRTVEFASATGKWLQIGFSADLVLLTHMLMSGSWHIYRQGEAWRKSRFHMRVAITTPLFVAVAFNVPIAEFHTKKSLGRREGFNSLGPDLLARDFDEAATVTALADHPDVEIGVALLDQSIIAGLGNVFKSEVCFLAKVNPFQRIGDLSRVQLESLVSIGRRVITANTGPGSGDQIVTYTAVRRTTGSSNPAERLWVYRRAGEPCRTCGALILTRKQGIAARTTFWCPICQAIAKRPTYLSSEQPDTTGR